MIVFFFYEKHRKRQKAAVRSPPLTLQMCLETSEDLDPCWIS